MSYVQSVLQKDENVRFVTNIHWITNVPGLALFALAIVVWVFYLQMTDGMMRTVVMMLTLILFGGALLVLFWNWFDRWTTEIAVTNKRIIHKRGFIRRKTIEMHMDKVESVDVDQSILGRLLDYGNIEVRGVGIGLDPLRTIARPIEFRNHVTAE